MGVGGQRHAPAALPPGRTRYPLYRRLGGPQGRSGRARKISPPPGFDPRTIQPVASRYTDWAIAAPYGEGTFLRNADKGVKTEEGGQHQQSAISNHEGVQILCIISIKMSKITKQRTNFKASYTLMFQPFVFKLNHFQFIFILISTHNSRYSLLPRSRIFSMCYMSHQLKLSKSP